MILFDEDNSASCVMLRSYIDNKIIRMNYFNTSEILFGIFSNHVHLQ